eukprot:1176592-Amphidinium_carterae.3
MGIRRCLYHALSHELLVHTCPTVYARIAAVGPLSDSDYALVCQKCCEDTQQPKLGKNMGVMLSA